MPRARKPASTIEDVPMPGLEELDADPTPKRGPGRPKKATSAGPKITHRNARGQATSVTALKQQVATELYGISTLVVGLIGFKDPCADRFKDIVQTPVGEMDRLGALVTQVVEILARNEKVLGAMASAGLIAQVGMVGTLLMPVVSEVWSAHGPGGHGHRGYAEEEIDYAQQYPAPAAAVR